jgi:16S rRNA (cytosine967-C5)-methyltransferase
MPGLQARRTAAALLRKIVDGRVPFDALVDETNGHREFRNLDARDRALVRTIVDIALRHRGEIRSALEARLDKPLDADSGGAIAAILHVGAAQILYMDVPDHAAVNLAVSAAESDKRIRNARGLVNSLMRRIARERNEILARPDAARLNAPDWLFARWAAFYGEATATRLTEAHLHRPALDLSARSDPAAVAEATGGTLLPSGTIRLQDAGRVSALAGYQEGTWWVQDAAAALPARLIDNGPGLKIADLCAAPGGKSAQLAAGGAEVTAVDLSNNRLKRLAGNLGRLKMNAVLVRADILDWQPDGMFDAVLLDAPCSATGTIRRHPDIACLKSESDIVTLAALQARMLERAADWVKPGGQLVYCTCSLEPEEGEYQAAAFLAARSDYRVDPVRADEIGGLTAALNQDGYLRTLPHMAFDHAPSDTGPYAGMDGFFAARFRRAG